MQEKFKIDKTSQLAQVNPSLSVDAYESLLNAEGFTGGYAPLAGKETSLALCLAERMPNLYFLKYGGIEELCVGGIARTTTGKTFTLKTAPRSATGPDFKRMLIGSQDTAAHFLETVLRIYPLPEGMAWGWISVDHEDKAFQMIRGMVAHFIHPLFATFYKDPTGIAEDIGISLPTDASLLIFKLAGPSRMVAAEKEAIAKLAEKENLKPFWMEQEESNSAASALRGRLHPALPVEGATQAPIIDRLDSLWITQENWERLLKLTTPLLGRLPKSGDTESEKKWLKHFESLAS